MTNCARPMWPSASKRCRSTRSTCRRLYSSRNRLHWTCWSASCFWIRRNLNSARAVSRRSSASLEESGSETIPFKIWWIERKWLRELKNQKRLELTHSPVCSIQSSILSMLGGGTPRWAAWGLDGHMLKVGVQSLIEYMHHFVTLMWFCIWVFVFHSIPSCQKQRRPFRAYGRLCFAPDVGRDLEMGPVCSSTWINHLLLAVHS